MRSGERGVALVVVLWFVIAAAAMSLTFIRHGQADLVQSRETLDVVQARALVDAGLARAVAEIVRSRDRRPIPDGLELVLDGGRALMRIEPESGKIDLNAADEVLIGSLGRVLGLDAKRADAIGEAVVDWRDEGDLRQPRGAEDQDYEAGGAAFGTPDEPFRSVEDLRYVLPVDQATFELLAPWLTVYTGEPRPQARLAGGPVRKAMEQRGEPRDEGDSLLTQTQGAGGNEGTAPPPRSKAEEPSTDGDEAAQDSKRIYSVTVSASLAGGYRRAERVVVWLPEQDSGPAFRVLDRGMILFDPDAAA